MKKNLLALFAVVLALAFSAFTTNSHPPKSTKPTAQWYTYNSSTFDATNEQTPGNYSVGSPASCFGSTNLCGLVIDPASDGDGSSLSATDILNVINSTSPDIDSNNDGVVDTEVTNVSDLKN